MTVNPITLSRRRRLMLSNTLSARILIENFFVVNGWSLDLFGQINNTQFKDGDITAIYGEGVDLVMKKSGNWDSVSSNPVTVWVDHLSVITTSIPSSLEISIVAPEIVSHLANSAGSYVKVTIQQL